MKSIFQIFLVSVVMLFTSCQTRIVTNDKPLRSNSLELYQKYTVQTHDGKIQKVQVLKQDETTITAKNKTGENVVINKSDIREVKKFNILGSVLIGLGAVAALILIPV